jgi:hypothetical protein
LRESIDEESEELPRLLIKTKRQEMMIQKCYLSLAKPKERILSLYFHLSEDQQTSTGTFFEKKYQNLKMQPDFSFYNGL